MKSIHMFMLKHSFSNFPAISVCRSYTDLGYLWVRILSWHWTKMTENSTFEGLLEGVKPHICLIIDRIMENK